MMQSLTGSLEEHVLALLCHSPAAVPHAGRIDANLFTTRHFRTVAKAALDHIGRFGRPPANHLADILESELNKGDLGKILWTTLARLEEIAPCQQAEYVLDEFDQFLVTHCKRRALAEASDALHKGDVAEADAAIQRWLEVRPALQVPSFDVATGFSLAELKAMKPDQFVYGMLAPTGYVTILHGRGGVAKSTCAVHVVASVVTGEALLGETVYLKGGNAAYALLEDDARQLYRMFAACAIQHGLSLHLLNDIKRWTKDQGGKLVVARLNRNGVVVPTDLVPRLIDWLRFHDIKLFVVDALIHTHSCEGSDNEQMAKVVEIWCDIATAADCAIVILAHDVKGSQGKVDSLRGAGAISDHARAVLSMRKMTKDEAKGFVEDGADADLLESYQDYACIGNEPKQNFRAAPKRALWFRVNAVVLPNDDTRPALTRWYPPDQKPVELAVGQRAAIIAEIDQGIDNGTEFYWKSSQSKDRWAGHLLARHKIVGRKQIDTVLGQLLEDGSLIESTYVSRQTRKRLQCLRAHS